MPLQEKDMVSNIDIPSPLSGDEMRTKVRGLLYEKAMY